MTITCNVNYYILTNVKNWWYRASIKTKKLSGDRRRYKLSFVFGTCAKLSSLRTCQANAISFLYFVNFFVLHLIWVRACWNFFPQSNISASGNFFFIFVLVKYLFPSYCPNQKHPFLSEVDDFQFIAWQTVKYCTTLFESSRGAQ